MTDPLIERLTSQGHMTQGDGLLALLDTGKEAATEIQRLRKENERLREALQEIAGIEAHDQYEASLFFDSAQHTARNALTEKDHE